MLRLLRILGLGLAIWLTAAAPGWAARGDDHTPGGDHSAQQVLVLLRMPPRHFRPNAEYGATYGAGPDAGARQRMAARLARRYGLTQDSSWPMPLLGLDCIVLNVPAGRAPAEVANLLSRDSGVVWSQPMNIYYSQGAPSAPNDPLYRVQPAAREWHLAELHRFATGRRVRVAVVDSLVQRSHPDLAGQVIDSEDFAPERGRAPERHGTGVAGIIAAAADNRLGVVGVAPGARIMALRACWQRADAADPSMTECNTLSLAKALYYAITHEAQVINLSLSGPPDILLSRLLDVAVGRGVTVVSAFDGDKPNGGFPASHAGVVAVADESQGQPKPGIYLAPGRDVPTTQPGGVWGLVNGDSYAAAHVSGLFALLRERGSVKQPSHALVTARGESGVVDARATLFRAVASCAFACAGDAK